MFKLSSDPTATSRPVSTKTSISPGDRLPKPDGGHSHRWGYTVNPSHMTSAGDRISYQPCPEWARHGTPIDVQPLTKRFKKSSETLRVKTEAGGKRLTNTNPVWRPSWSSAEQQQRQGWLTSGEREREEGERRRTYRRERERACADWPTMNES